jgi:hypothetical protein
VRGVGDELEGWKDGAKGWKDGRLEDGWTARQKSGCKVIPQRQVGTPTNLTTESKKAENRQWSNAEAKHVNYQPRLHPEVNMYLY